MDDDSDPESDAFTGSEFESDGPGVVGLGERLWVAAAAARTPMARPLISLACHDKTPHASATCSLRRGLLRGDRNDCPV